MPGESKPAIVKLTTYIEVIQPNDIEERANQVHVVSKVVGNLIRERLQRSGYKTWTEFEDSYEGSLE